MDKETRLQSMIDRPKEFRMMGFVPYNISGIQAGIQFGHAVVEYSIDYGNSSKYIDYAKNYKTFIILNGGTTNSNKESKYYGSMDQTLETIKSLGCIEVSEFREPDLNDGLSAFVFIADEKLFDHYAYPMLEEYQFIRYNDEYRSGIETNKFNTNSVSPISIVNAVMINKEKVYEQYAKDYMEIIGGEARYEIKKILKSARLANN